MFQFPDRFEALFAQAMHVHGTSEGTLLSWDEVATRIHELARNEQRLPAGEFTPEDLTDARFAAYAFVDELLFRSPRPGEDSGLGWSAHALQNRYFGTNDGGELFYARLENLFCRLEQERQQGAPLSQAAQSGMELLACHSADLPARFRAVAVQDASSSLAALAVFAQCLAWGFRGKMYASEEALVELRSAACTLLNATCTPLPAVDVPSAVSKVRVPLLTDCEPLLHVLGPLAISVAWYFLCADIITRAILF